ncbi:MAG: sigma-70 family RNA polymerase sigma factor [Planctomycetaceae bacterium]|nr:sigma-70 family RNA polymerase sigma factor [Planctomycetaceae bacterium]
MTRSDQRDENPTDVSADERSAASDTEELFALVYGELHKLADRQLASEPSGMTLQATALVHEAYLKLSGGDRTWSGRRQFFAAAAEAMRRILVDHARRRKRLRRGGDRKRVPTDLGLLPEVRPDDEVLALADVLSAFENEDPRAAELVKLRYFVGMSLDEAAEVMGVSRSTAARDWSYAKAWLLGRLSNEQPADGEGKI